MFKVSFMAIAVIIGVLVGLYLIKVCNENNKVKTDYDERQEAIRGRGFKYGFYTALSFLGVLTVLDIGDVTLPAQMCVIYFGILIVSMLVETSYSIWNDAYFGTNSNIKKYITVFMVITLINGFASVAYALDGQLIVDGILTSGFINVECTIAFLILGIEYAIRNKQIDANCEEADEDEES